VETGRPVPGSIFKQYMRYLNASVRSIVTEAGNKRCGDAGLPELSSILISVHCGTMHGLHSFSSYDLPRESYARDSRKRRRPVMIVKFAKCTEEVSRFHCRDMDSLEKWRALLQFFFSSHRFAKWPRIPRDFNNDLPVFLGRMSMVVTSPHWKKRLVAALQFKQ